MTAAKSRTSSQNDNALLELNINIGETKRQSMYTCKSARQYGPILTRNDFRSITVDKPETYGFMEGDIVVMAPTRHGNQAGHIAGFDGANRVSDFVQHGFWPGPTYEREKPAYVVYRR